ncbi:alpha helical protein [Caballeronia sp. AZ10_KS36]|uniref:zinc ribbon-containing protein n=1 Tax=Caballeronia sp. AZ10_KS36 TaxID=2921757 RepID=UPI002541127C|nr:alpha helical protein [Caballeronia sp. AZ10_KS36]
MESEAEATMSAHSGEKAEKTGDFRCARCHHSTHVTKGHTIPKCPKSKCPKCGNDTYSTRVREPGNKSS